jgi:hypothetical protein
MKGAAPFDTKLTQKKLARADKSRAYRTWSMTVRSYLKSHEIGGNQSFKFCRNKAESRKWEIFWRGWRLFYIRPRVSYATGDLIPHAAALINQI